MIRLIKVCFWIAVVVVFLPEDSSSGQNGQKFSTAGAIELANAGIKDVSEFCVRNPSACLQGKDAMASLSQKTINTARSIYDYINETSTNDAQNGLEQVISKNQMLSIEQQIKIAQTNGQTLSVSDLNIDFSAEDIQ